MECGRHREKEENRSEERSIGRAIAQSRDSGLVALDVQQSVDLQRVKFISFFTSVAFIHFIDWAANSCEI